MQADIRYCVAICAYAKIERMNRYAPIGDFSKAFAQEYKAFMVANDIKGFQIAEKLDRAIGYVSERVNGKRPLDTEDVDALAMLVPGWSGRTLLLELARRAKETMAVDSSNVVRLEDHRRIDQSGTTDLEIEYNPDTADQEVSDALADRHAALIAEDPTPEQEAPPTA